MALLKPEQAAKHLGITLERLGELTEGNQIAHYTLGNAVRYRVEDLDSFVEESEALWERHEPVDAAPTLSAEPPSLLPARRPVEIAKSGVIDAEFFDEDGISGAELERRRSLARAVADSPTGPGLPAEGKVFSRPVGQIQADDGSPVDAPDPFSGFSPEEVAGCGHPPEST
jgi:excisionase family DNA binding protein